MKILIDMNLSPAWVEFLNKAGYEAAHWTTLGAPRIPDTPMLGYAAKRDFVVLTQDLELSAILASQNTERPGVLQIASAHNMPDVAGAQVVAALRKAAPALEQRAVVTVDPVRRSMKVLQPT
jgi:predicted nuclease of predicted toxin-antitoxin system